MLGQQISLHQLPMSQSQISSGISGWCHVTFTIIYPISLETIPSPFPPNFAPLAAPAINFWRRDTAFLARKDSKTASSKPTALQTHGISLPKRYLLGVFAACYNLTRSMDKLIFAYHPTPPLNDWMSTLKRDVCSKRKGSSNHHFSGDILVFQRCKPQNSWWFRQFLVEPPPNKKGQPFPNIFRGRGCQSWSTNSEEGGVHELHLNLEKRKKPSKENLQYTPTLTKQENVLLMVQKSG